jgi:hypothetical protein
MEIGKLLSRCGWPGIVPISCLLVGRSIVCAGSSHAVRRRTELETDTRVFVIMPKTVAEEAAMPLHWEVKTAARPTAESIDCSTAERWA